MCKPKWQVNYTTRRKTRIVCDHETNGLVTDLLYSYNRPHYNYGKWKTKTRLMGLNFCLTAWVLLLLLLLYLLLFLFSFFFLRNRSDFHLYTRGIIFFLFPMLMQGRCHYKFRAMNFMHFPMFFITTLTNKIDLTKNLFFNH